MTKPGLLLLGAGGHARACIDVIEQHGGFRIVGLIGSAGEVGTRILSHAVIGTDEDLTTLAGTHRHALVVVGQIASPALRMRLQQQAIAAGLTLPTIVSPRAYVSPHARLGAGSIVMHGAILNAGAQVGDNCIINSRALVEHDAQLGDHCHLSTGAIVNGNARIGAGSFIGSGSVIREGLSIGPHCVIGMGMAVRNDLAADTRYVGTARHD